MNVCILHSTYSLGGRFVRADHHCRLPRAFVCLYADEDATMVSFACLYISVYAFVYKHVVHVCTHLCTNMQLCTNMCTHVCTHDHCSSRFPFVILCIVFAAFVHKHVVHMCTHLICVQTCGTHVYPFVYKHAIVYKHVYTCMYT
jgi:hypothetical protein